MDFFISTFIRNSSEDIPHTKDKRKIDDHLEITTNKKQKLHKTDTLENTLNIKRKILENDNETSSEYTTDNEQMEKIDESEMEKIDGGESKKKKRKNGKIERDRY